MRTSGMITACPIAAGRMLVRGVGIHSLKCWARIGGSRLEPKFQATVTPIAMKTFFTPIVTWALLAFVCVAGSSALTPTQNGTDYKKDVEFALDELEKRCGHFFKVKDISWKKVRTEFKKSGKKVKTDQEHLLLMVRLLARLEDGHAQVRFGDKLVDFEVPEDMFPQPFGPGMTWSRVGKEFFVRTADGDAEQLGLKPGMQIIKVDGVKVAKWVDERIAFLSDINSFSTDHQAEFFALTKGLGHPEGTRLKLDLKDEDGKSMKRTVTCTKKRFAPEGPAVFPGEVEGDGDMQYMRTETGYGYIHIRRCKGELPKMVDAALAHIGEVKGLLIDFRGNPGGSFDHDEFLGRFVPKGEVLSGGGKSYPSTGDMPYGGPIVVLVDGTVCSAGETASGIFKEDGRGYMIGESPTAGMSSSKETIELPSGLFNLYVSVHSNKARFQNGRGIEGIGVEPHELVPMNPEDLVAGKDTLIERGLQILQDFPESKVPYKPARHGWKAPE